MIVPQKIEVIAQVVEGRPSTVRCPFCDQIHQHGIDKDEADSLVHRVSDCSDSYFQQMLNRKGLRRKRRHQLEEGRALRERAGGGYFICVRAKVRK